MAEHSPLAVLDSIAHFLYCPTMHGKRLTVARWHHRIHLIPAWLMRWICDRYDRTVWAGFDADETFYEDDEPLEKVVAAFEHGEKFVTGAPRPRGLIPGSGHQGEPRALASSHRLQGWTCPHLTISSAPGLLAGPPVKSMCDCEMRPIYAAPA